MHYFHGFTQLTHWSYIAVQRTLWNQEISICFVTYVKIKIPYKMFPF